MTRFRRQARDERGSALVTAMLVMMICLIAGFAVMNMVDAGQNSSRVERTNESTFSLAEGVLNAEVFMLSTQWPANDSPAFAYPSSCTPSSTSPLCPDAATLAKNYPGVDYAAGIQWSTEVHDEPLLADGRPDPFYDDAAVRSQPTWDSNHDNLMWVRAQAVVRGERRTLIALVKAEKLDTLFPRNAIVANQLDVLPNGNQNYVNTGNSYVTLRCGDGHGGSLTSSVCKGWTKTVNVGPNATVNVDPTARPALTPETLDRMREYAKANGTYFASGCQNLAGDVVFIEVGDCDYHGNDEWNTAEQPGVLIIGSGTITLGGNTTYHGVIYDANGSGGTGAASTDTVVTLQGNGCVQGSVVIDGGGGLQVGSSHGASKCGGNLSYDANAANHLAAYGTAGIVQNSFREISAGP